MTLADPTIARPSSVRMGWFARIMPRRRPVQLSRFEPIADLPAYLLFDIGLPRDRFDTDVNRRW
jgi:hypothetical protein